MNKSLKVKSAPVGPTAFNNLFINRVWYRILPVPILRMYPGGLIIRKGYMSHKQLAKQIEADKPGKSASSRLGREVRDSFRTIESYGCITNTTGTFTRFIKKQWHFISGWCLWEGSRGARRSFSSERTPREGNRRQDPLIKFLLAIPIISLVLLSVIAFNTNNTYATTSSISIGISGNPTINLLPTKDGKFTDSGDATITVTTNHAAGYTLGVKATGSSNPTSLKNGSGTVGFTTLESAIDYNTFNTNTNYNGKWGYKPSTIYNGTTTIANTNYLPSPTTSGSILAVTNNANNGSYTVSIGARANINTNIGSYSNTFLFTIIGNPTPYTVTYNANAGNDAVANMPTVNPQSGTVDGDSVALSINVPTRSGYYFNGWCTNQMAANTACSGTTFAAGASYILDQTAATNTPTLYALWQQADNMQNYTKAACQANATNNDLVLLDARDNKSYTVRYLNGNCWMTQNLAIEPGTHMTRDDTNISPDQYLSGEDYYALPGEGYDLKANGAEGGNCYGDIDSGSSYFNACTHVADAANVSAISNLGYTKEQLGAWYNYAAATAGSVYGIFNSTVATYDICPAGWRLPTGGINTGEIYNLAAALASDNTIFNPLYGATYTNGWNNPSNLVGVWWSNMVYGQKIRNNMLYENDVLRANASYRVTGNYIRCIMDTRTIADITYMQDITPNIVENTATNATATLKDKRDQQDYTVAKLADGKVWMTTNLNIAGGTLLNSDTTDFDSSYSLPTTQNWQSDGSLPASSTSGFNQDNYAYVYNSGNNTTNCADGQPCYSYYSWDVATLGSGRSIGTEDTDAPYSICPKGWKLPKSGDHTVNDPNKQSGWKRGDSYALATAYGVNLESAYYSNTSTFFNNAGKGTPANFLRAGYYGGGSFGYGGTRGRYWSSTSYGNTSYARNLYFGFGYVNSADGDDRYYGFSVRCLVAQ